MKFQLLNTKLVIISVFTLQIVLKLNSKLSVVYFINCKLYLISLHLKIGRLDVDLYDWRAIL